MKSFKEYSKQAAEVASKQEEERAEDAATAEELTRRIAAAYNGKSNMSVMRNILAEAERSKRAGTLSNEEIDVFYQNFSPMLNGFQRRQLREIVRKLKEI